MMRALAIAVASLLLLGCGDRAIESDEVDVALSIAAADNCPSITSAVAAPAQTSVGGTIAVSAAASADPDHGDAVSFSWSPAARFASPSSAATSYSCTTGGKQTLTLTITDGHRPAPCSANVALEVECVAGRGAGP